MIDFRLIEKEIQLAEDECCIIFDFGCYFPYTNYEILTFDFMLGMEELDDYKINHRYPNRNYQTITKKYGRKVSKLGYPYIMKLNEQKSMLLCLNVGIKKEYITMIFPLLTNMTKDKPVCVLSLYYNFDKHEFRFESYEKSENNGWYQHNWYNHDIENDRKCDSDIVLSTPSRFSVFCGDSYALVYEDIIEPYPLPVIKSVNRGE